MRTQFKTEGVTRDPRPRTASSPVNLTIKLEELVGRFQANARAVVRRLVFSSPRLADLAAVFPGAVFALATRQGSARDRRAALAMIESGAQLKDVARKLKLPLWLRRLPPEAFSGSLDQLPSSELFARRIVNVLPPAEANAAFWLRSVIFASRAVDDYFALWLAGQRVFVDDANQERLFAILAAYAWFSGADDARARNFIVVPWRPEMSFDTALCAAKSWFNRVRLVLQLKEGVLDDPWLKPGEALGHKFVPLLSDVDVLGEAQAMHNCADQYAERLARERCRLFSVRRNGVRVATLEIGPHPRETGVLAINQLKARHNMSAHADVWLAAHAWMSQQKDLKRIPLLAPPDRPLDLGVWNELMMPYRLARNGTPWLADDPTLAAFAVMDLDICDLARRGGVSSWLFT